MEAQRYKITNNVSYAEAVWEVNNTPSVQNTPDTTYRQIVATPRPPVEPQPFVNGKCVHKCLITENHGSRSCDLIGLHV